MIALIRKNLRLWGYGKSLALFTGCILFSISGRLNGGIAYERHILSAVSDHYYLTYFVLPIVLLSCFSFIDDDGELIILRFQSYHSYFLKKWIGVGLIAVILTAVQTGAILLSGIGLPLGNEWNLAAGATEAELFSALEQLFASPLQAFVCFTLYQLIGSWLIFGICMWIGHFTGRKWTIRIVIVLYVLSAVWIKLPAIQNIPLTSFNHLLILHHNFGEPARPWSTGFTLLLFMLTIMFSVRFAWRGHLPQLRLKCHGIAAYYSYELMTKRNILILLAVVVGITLYKGLGYGAAESDAEWIYSLFAGHGTGYFQVFPFLEMAKKRANGEGNIRKRADGRWEGRYTAGYHPETGKRIIKNVLGKTQAECKAKLSAAMEASRGIDVSRADEYTVATWLRSWYEIYAKPNIRISTANRYQLMVEQYTIPRIGSIKLTKLTAHDLQKLYKDLMENGRIDRKSGHGNPGLSSTTVRSLHLMLHSAFERAVKERLILRNPTEDCIAPKVQKIEMQILPPEHIKDYLEAADRRGLLPMFYLELVTGLRKGEITALLWSDLDAKNKTISVSKQYIKNPNGELTLSRPKTETSVRKVSIPQEAVDLLIAEHGKHPENPYMFPSPVTGEMYYPDSVVNLHKKILKDAGLPHIRFHDLRHTFATLALQNGVDVKTVSSMLGHYDAGFTLRTYTHATRQKQDEAAQTMGSFMAQVM